MTQARQEFEYLGFKYDVGEAKRLTEGLAANTVLRLDDDVRQWLNQVKHKVIDSHVPEVDISEPVIAVVRKIGKNHNILIIDGLHRIAKALGMQKTTLPMHMLTATEERRCRIT